MRKLSKYHLFSCLNSIVLVGTLFSCAQRAVLSGGSKDDLPPEINYTLPKNQVLNFASKEIVVEFNEFVRLNNLQKQLIVSPLMKEKPEVTIKGKKMVIKLPANLEENTTYSLNFGDAIMDITENNPYPNYKYVFSTGDLIDSLTFSGKLVNAEDLVLKEHVFVMLYNQLDDSVPLKQRPNYLTTTKNDGTFMITNIAKGNYKVFALDDINGNYLYDLPNEEVAFLEKPIQLDSNIENVSLFLFKKENKKQFVKKIESKQYGELTVKLNAPEPTIVLMDLLGKPYHIIAQETDKNNLTHTFWLNETTEENNKTNSKQTFIIKNENGVIDTVQVDMISKSKTDTVLSINSNVFGVFDLNRKIILSSNQPIAEFFKNKIKLYEDSVLVDIKIEKDSVLATNINIDYNFKENTNYVFLAEPKAITSIYQLKNDSVRINFKTKKEADYGNLKFTIVPDFKENYSIQFFLKKELIHEFFDKDKKIVNITYLKPGDYEVRLIIDNNNNKKWDTGDYENNIQPERVVRYKDNITIRENWDNEIEWNILINRL